MPNHAAAAARRKDHAVVLGGIARYFFCPWNAPAPPMRSSPVLMHLCLLACSLLRTCTTGEISSSGGESWGPIAVVANGGIHTDYDLHAVMVRVVPEGGMIADGADLLFKWDCNNWLLFMKPRRLPCPRHDYNLMAAKIYKWSFIMQWTPHEFYSKPNCLAPELSTMTMLNESADSLLDDHNDPNFLANLEKLLDMPSRDVEALDTLAQFHVDTSYRHQYTIECYNITDNTSHCVGAFVGHKHIDNTLPPGQNRCSRHMKSNLSINLCDICLPTVGPVFVDPLTADEQMLAEPRRSQNDMLSLRNVPLEDGTVAAPTPILPSQAPDVSWLPEHLRQYFMEPGDVEITTYEDGLMVKYLRRGTTTGREVCGIQNPPSPLLPPNAPMPPDRHASASANVAPMRNLAIPSPDDHGMSVQLIIGPDSRKQSRMDKEGRKAMCRELIVKIGTDAMKRSLRSDGRDPLADEIAHQRRGYGFNEFSPNGRVVKNARTAAYARGGP